jgi:hypothetical protein
MCEGQHHHHGTGRGFRGFGRRGFPSKEVWLERLQAYEQHLEQELANVRDVLERLGGSGDAPQQTGLV